MGQRQAQGQKDAAVVRLTEVHKHYRLGDTKVHALRGLSLEIGQGEFTAVLGASGSGKSTLLNLIGCIDLPDSGGVRIADVDVVSIGDAERSRLRNECIGFIFQAFNLVPVLSVFENVELPLLIHPRIPASERRERVLTNLEQVGLAEKKDRWPHHLSGGERQRVAIARALVTDPALVLADEPTANLDSVTAHKIIDLMRELNQRRQTTFFFATHDEKLVSRVDRRLSIRDGVFVE